MYVCMYAHKRSAVFFSHKAEHGVLVSPVAVQPLLLLQFCAMGSSGRGISAFSLVAAMYIATGETKSLISSAYVYLRMLLTEVFS